MGRRLRTATALLDVHLVAALVQAGAEAAAADAHGRTPLHALAVAASTDAATEKAGPILRILLARGAKVCAVLRGLQVDETLQHCGMTAAGHVQNHLRPGEHYSVVYDTGCCTCHGEHIQMDT
jgi:hypothetical protein